MIFVNLPVADLARATAFYEAIGFTLNPAFSDEKASCMVLSDRIYVMLLTREYFATFTPRPVADARAGTEVLLCISTSGRGEVDHLVTRALAAGGNEMREVQDLGFMYSRSFEDPDGHVWEPMFMDMEAAGTAMAPAAA